MAAGAYQVTVSIVDKFTSQLDKFNAQLKKVQMQADLAFAPFANFQNSLKQSYALISKGLGLDKVGNFMKGILESALRIGKVFASLVGIGSLFSLGGLMAGLRGFGEQGLELSNMQTRTGMNASKVDTLDTANYLAGGRKGALAEGMERSGELAFAASYGQPAGFNAAWLRQSHGMTGLRPDGTAKTGEELIGDDRQIIRSYKDPRQQVLAAQMLGHSKEETPLLAGSDKDFAQAMQDARATSKTPEQIEQARQLELQIRKLTNSFTGLANTLFKAMSPTVMRLMEDFQRWLDGTSVTGQKNIDALAQSFENMGNWVENAVTNLKDIGMSIKEWIPDLQSAKIWAEALFGIWAGAKLAGIMLAIGRFAAAIKLLGPTTQVAAAESEVALAALGATATKQGGIIALATSKITTAVEAMGGALATATAGFTALLAAATTYAQFKMGKQEADITSHGFKPSIMPFNDGGEYSSGNNTALFERNGKTYTREEAQKISEEEDKKKSDINTMTIRPEADPNQNPSLLQLNKDRDDLQRKLDELNKKISDNTDATKSNTDATKPRTGTNLMQPDKMFRMPFLGPSVANNFATSPDRSSTPGQEEPNAMTPGIPQNFHPPAYVGPAPGVKPQSTEEILKNWPNQGQPTPTPAPMPMPQQRPIPETTPTQMPKTFIPGDKQSFINTFRGKAEEISKRTGIDPDIILAQSGLESGWGASAPNNNYFGIKGPGSSQTTHEFINGKMQTVTANFAGYKNPFASFDGYGQFMLDNPRYNAMRNAKGVDAQLEELRKSGYATDPRYIEKLRTIINAKNMHSNQNINNNQTTPNNVIQFPTPLVNTNGPSVEMPPPAGPAVNMNMYNNSDDNQKVGPAQQSTGSDNQTSGHISVSIDHKNVPPNVRLSANATGNAFRGPVNVNTRNLPGFNTYYG